MKTKLLEAIKTNGTVYLGRDVELLEIVDVCDELTDDFVDYERFGEYEIHIWATTVEGETTWKIICHISK
jgi:hypothetical protein